MAVKTSVVVWSSKFQTLCKRESYWGRKWFWPVVNLQTLWACL